MTLRFQTIAATAFLILIVIATSWTLSPGRAVSTSQLSSVSEASLYESSIQPIFNQRCIACHSCNTAPCQLNFTNYEGAVRGASKTPINQPYNQSPSPLTRLGIDATSTEGWRALKFFSVTESSPGASSNLVHALELKEKNPLLTPSIKAEKAKTCPADDKQWAQFEKNHPDMGMPYGLPALTRSQKQTLLDWVKQGAAGPNERERQLQVQPSNREGFAVIKRVQEFLNAPSLKAKLASRYLYEHLFLAHLRFEKEMPREFFRVVRSRTACEKGISEIASRRPYDDPGVKEFFYCLRKHDQTITEKNHIVYEMSDARLARWQTLFFSKPWSVTQLPSYDEKTSSNPFQTFRELPAEARYQWLLDDAQYTVMTFIKGNVCRGSTAVNVIDEKFQILFLDPKSDHFVQDSRYADKVTPLLKLPGKYGSNVKVVDFSTKILPFLMSHLKSKRNDYREARDLKYAEDRPQGYSANDLWNGDGWNRNAVLTVFRHFDSAQVLKGAWGGQPKTAWVLDYPLFERIVYDLVAGYDNNGSMAHQVLTRVYMHYIRMEAEENFLSFLPAEIRVPMRAYWYRKGGDVNKRYPLNSGTGRLSQTSMAFKISALPDDRAGWEEIKAQFFKQVYGSHLNASVMGPRDQINASPSRETLSATVDSEKQFELELRKVVSRPASELPFSQYLDDTAFLRLVVDGSGKDRVYTLVRNKEHFNIASILGERGRREPINDSLSILPGFQASYPNRFFVVDLKGAASFLVEMQNIRSQTSARKFISKYGIARENPNFWSSYDWFMQKSVAVDPVEAGAIDLNRYGNAEPLPEDDENSAD